MIPSTLKIGATEWNVEITDKLDCEDDLGDCDESKLRIRVHAAQSEQAREIILIHEILHAACRVVRIDEEKLTEEEFVNRLDYVLHTILRENDFWPT